MTFQLVSCFHFLGGYSLSVAARRTDVSSTSRPILRVCFTSSHFAVFDSPSLFKAPTSKPRIKTGLLKKTISAFKLQHVPFIETQLIIQILKTRTRRVSTTGFIRSSEYSVHTFFYITNTNSELNSKAAIASRSECPNEGLLTPEPQRPTSCSSRNDATAQIERGRSW